MNAVNVNPMPNWCRSTKYRQCPPPLFTDGSPTRDELELALALIAELDPESRNWYGAELQDRLRARLDAC